MAILNRLTGHQETPLDTNLTIIAALFVGWLSGRNRRLRGSAKALVLDRKVRLVGVGITIISYVYGVVIGLLTFAIELRIVSDAAGFWGFVVAFVVAPLTFAVAPLYAGIAQENWLPAIFAYGGLITMYLGIRFGNVVTEVPD